MTCGYFRRPLRGFDSPGAAEANQCVPRALPDGCEACLHGLAFHRIRLN